MNRESRVTGVRLTPVAFAEPPLRNSAGVHGPLIARLIIEVETAAGAVGLGETFGDPRMVSTAAAAVSLIRGCDVFDTADLGRRLGVNILQDGQLDVDAGSGVPRPGTFAGTLGVKLYSAFEVAFLDAQGKLVGRPVHQLLGGRIRDSVEFCGYLFYKFAAHPGEAPDRWGPVQDPEAMVGLAQDFIDRFGFRSLKIKGGVLEPDAEVATIHRLAAAFPDVTLRIDPNAAWTVPTSIDIAERARGLLQYLEDPTPGLEGMAEVAHQAGIPLATNMVATSFQQLKQVLTRRSASIVLADHHFWGGLRATQWLGVTGTSTGVELSMHSNSHLGISLAAMVHAAAVLPGLRYSCDTHYPWVTDDVVDPPEIKDGHATVSDDPGLGVVLDHDRLARLHQTWQDAAPIARDDVAAMRRYVPDWTDQRPRW
jgi:glucarate dehydratase